jgi:hypothetical protein
MMKSSVRETRRDNFGETAEERAGDDNSIDE